MTAPLATVVSQKRAVIFDLFHTLTDRESTWGRNRPPTHRVLGISKATWDEQLHRHSRSRLIGEQRDALAIVAAMARAVNPATSDDLIRRATENRIARFADALMNIPPSTREVLATIRARGQKLALISNADVMEVAAWDRSPLAAFFDVALFSCHVGHAKPEPEIYRECLKRLALSPADCLFVGDGGSHELAGARSLGLATVMIAGVIRELWPERIEERARQADYQIEELAELIG